MRKIIYLSAMIFGLTACSSTGAYDAFISTLENKVIEIDSITSKAEYADYIAAFESEVNAFASKGIALEQAQIAKIDSISAVIQDKVIEKYNFIISTDTITCVADTTEIIK